MKEKTDVKYSFHVCLHKAGKIMIKITVSLAGVPVECRFRHRENQEFLTEYETGEPAAFAIEPGPAELADMAAKLRQEKGIPDEAEIPAWYIENTALHSMIAEELIRYDALLVHGSAIAADGDAYLFIASSGTGKSTHTRLWRELLQDRAWMLNDDKPLLRLQDGVVLAYGTPWDGKHHLSRNASAPLKGIARIKRSENNHIERLSEAEAFPIFYRHAFRTEDRARMQKILSIEQSIIRVVPFYSLACNMEPEAASLAFETMKNGGRTCG